MAHWSLHKLLNCPQIIISTKTESNRQSLMSLSLSGRLSSLARSNFFRWNWIIPWPWWLKNNGSFRKYLGGIKKLRYSLSVLQASENKGRKGRTTKASIEQTKFASCSVSTCLRVHSPVCGQDLHTAGVSFIGTIPLEGILCCLFPASLRNTPVYKWLGAAPDRSLFGFWFRVALL